MGYMIPSNTSKPSEDVNITIGLTSNNINFYYFQWL